MKSRDTASRESTRDSKAVSLPGNSRPGTTEGSVKLPHLQQVNVEEVLEELRENCMNYVFPVSKTVSHKAVVRLSVYAKYGPAVEDIDGKMKLNGARALLQPHEEKLILQEEERTLLYEVYGAAPMSVDKRRERLGAGNVASIKSRIAANTASQACNDAAVGEMNSKKIGLAHHLFEITKRELRSVLEAVGIPEGKPKKRSTVADCISNALLVERERRIRLLKGSNASLTELRKDTDVTNLKATRFYNRSFPKAYEIRNFEDPRDILQSLHRHAYQITEHSDRNRPDVNYNIRCLRSEFKPDNNRDGWDNYACIRNAREGKATSLRK